MHITCARGLPSHKARLVAVRLSGQASKRDNAATISSSEWQAAAMAFASSTAFPPLGPSSRRKPGPIARLGLVPVESSRGRMGPGFRRDDGSDLDEECCRDD